MEIVCYKCKKVIENRPYIHDHRKFKILCLQCYKNGAKHTMPSQEKNKVMAEIHNTIKDYK